MDHEVAVSPNNEDEIEIEKKPIQFLTKKAEAMIVEYVYDLLKENHVKIEHVDVALSYDLGNALSAVMSGYKIKFVINWNEKMQIQNIVKDFVRLYYKRDLRRTMEVISYALVNDQIKKWRKEMFTSEEEIIMDLLPKKRLEVIHRDVTTIRDSVTGEEFTIEHTNKKTRFNGDDFKLWVAISRLVLSKQMEDL